MYILETSEMIDPNEPQLGSITDSELIEEDGEGREIFIQSFVDNQALEEIYFTKDDKTDEDIPLKVEDYFSNQEIDWLNDMFCATSEWTEEQICMILDKI